MTKINSERETEEKKCMEILLVCCALQLNFTVELNLFAMSVSANSNNKTGEKKNSRHQFAAHKPFNQFKLLPIIVIIVYFLF